MVKLVILIAKLDQKMLIVKIQMAVITVIAELVTLMTITWSVFRQLTVMVHKTVLFLTEESVKNVTVLSCTSVLVMTDTSLAESHTILIA